MTPDAPIPTLRERYRFIPPLRPGQTYIVGLLARLQILPQLTVKQRSRMARPLSFCGSWVRFRFPFAMRPTDFR